MARKIIKEEFLKRFYRVSQNENIEIIEYTAISKPCIIKCNKCGKKYKKNTAKAFIGFVCECNTSEKIKYDRVLEIFSKLKDYDIIKKVDKDNVIVKHLVCGNEFKRTIKSCLEYPEHCNYCNTVNIKNMVSIDEAREKIKEKFNNEIQLLNYNSIHKQCLFRCTKCGLIFKKKYNNLLLYSRGCPKCDKVRSKGELLMK